LLLIANGAPVVAKMIWRNRFVVAVDGGLSFIDGQRLLGPNKTVRGLLCALIATSFVALMLGLPWYTGLLIAIGAMAGDLLSSFVKRRFRVAPHSSALGLDQIPEALLPLLLVKADFALDGWSIFLILVGFSATEWCLSYLVERFDMQGMAGE